MEETRFLDSVVQIEKVEDTFSKEWESDECHSEGENSTPYIQNGYVKLSTVYAIVTAAVVMTAVLTISSGLIVYCVTTGTREREYSTVLSIGTTVSVNDSVMSRLPAGTPVEDVVSESSSIPTATENITLISGLQGPQSIKTQDPKPPGEGTR